MIFSKSTGFVIPGIGKQITIKLAKLNIFSMEDLLFHLPSRYQDRTKLSTIGDLKVDQEVLIQGRLLGVTTPERGRTQLVCRIGDETGCVQLRFFHLFPFQMKQLQPEKLIRCFGTVKMGPQGLQMVHPEWQVISDHLLPVESHLTPIYPATEGVSQNMLRKFIKQALTWMATPTILPELIPSSDEVLNLMTLKDALIFLHQPPANTSLVELAAFATDAHKRLIVEELVAHRMSLLQLKRTFQAKKSAILNQPNELMSLFYQNIPYQLTQAQQRVVSELLQDLGRSSPMLRLVQGDVGSGKTIIAAIAIGHAVFNGYQAAMMAPTELLAEQHYRLFEKWFQPIGIKVVFVSGRLNAKAKGIAQKAIEEGDAQIILGTHALFQQSIQFKNLALVVTDEQHRFGVAQRNLFFKKGIQNNYSPHQLMLTATPIPRTLAMSFYADLDVSVIDELPPGRMPIVTRLISNDRRNEVINSIQKACHEGRQVYWVCPLIDQSETQTSQAVTSVLTLLKKSLPHLSIELIHGRVSAQEKEKIMYAFQQGNINILVATTVIEVGVDVPNASIMIIENAERLGLSQLHQLRGRVGRGCISSFCMLLYQSPLSVVAKQRLQVMRDITDGFEIAKKDLMLRGPGEVLGTRQTGEMMFRIADLSRDADMLPAVQQVAEMIQKDFFQMNDELIQRWLEDKVNYSSV